MNEIKEKTEERRITRIGGLVFKGESEFIPDDKKTKLIFKHKDMGKVIRYRHWEIGNTLEKFKKITGIESDIEAVEKFKGFLDEFKNDKFKDYDINIPKTEYILGKGNEEDKEKSKETYLYLVAEKIRGKNLKDILNSEELTIKYQEFIEKIIGFQIKYIGDKIKKREPFIFDVRKLDSFMIGKQKGDRKEKIYFVDNDCIITSQENMEYINFKVSVISEIKKGIQKLGNTFEKYFSEFRENLEKLTEYWKQNRINN